MTSSLKIASRPPDDGLCDDLRTNSAKISMKLRLYASAGYYIYAVGTDGVRPA